MLHWNQTVLLEVQEDHFITSALTFTFFFKSMVMPILEYGHCVWKHDEEKQKGLCTKLEKVQKRVTKLFCDIKDLSYTERLWKLNLPSLEHRRKRGEAIEVYKYLHGLYNVPSLSFEKIVMPSLGETKWN